jgi:hypothetical protein
MKAIFDSNILIDFLNEVPPSKEEVLNYEKVSISIITWIEILVGLKSQKEILKGRSFLSKVEVLNINQEIAEKAVEIRKDSRKKLPDALIEATALVNNLLLVTRNTKDFDKEKPWIRVPYEL